MKTFSAKGHEVKRDWLIIDASEKVLGRLATEIARRLRGKHKAEYNPSRRYWGLYCCYQCEKVTVTGRKFKNKMYYHHTGFLAVLSQLILRNYRQETLLKLLSLL